MADVQDLKDCILEKLGIDGVGNVSSFSQDPNTGVITHDDGSGNKNTATTATVSDNADGVSDTIETVNGALKVAKNPLVDINCDQGSLLFDFCDNTQKRFRHKRNRVVASYPNQSFVVDINTADGTVLYAMEVPLSIGVCPDRYSIFGTTGYVINNSIAGTTADDSAITLSHEYSVDGVDWVGFGGGFDSVPLVIDAFTVSEIHMNEQATVLPQLSGNQTLYYRVVLIQNGITDPTTTVENNRTDYTITWDELACC